MTWSNEFIPGRHAKQPVPMRAYFDRQREPERHRTDTGDKFKIRGGRVKPQWKLGDKPMPETLHQPESLTSTGRMPVFEVTPAMTRGEGGWHSRHQLGFVNEEVNVMTRSYFDRWREPEVLEDKAKGQRLLPTWRLHIDVDAFDAHEGKDCFPGQDAAIMPADDLFVCRSKCLTDGFSAFVVQDGKAYFKTRSRSDCLDSLQDASGAITYVRSRDNDVAAAGDSMSSKPETSTEMQLRESHWDARHQLTWCNDFLRGPQIREEQKLQTNTRSYFDRILQPKVEKGSKIREKLREEEKLPPTWSLQDYGTAQGPMTLSRSFRSAPELKRKRQGWHARHGNIF